MASSSSAKRRRHFHQRREEALQHVGIRLQGQNQELLDLPVDLLGFIVFELFGHAVERPVQISRRHVDAPPIRVRVGIVQSVSPRSDHAAVDDPLVQVALPGSDFLMADFALLVSGERHDIALGHRCFNAVKEANPVARLIVRGGRTTIPTAPRGCKTCPWSTTSLSATTWVPGE